MFGLTKREQRWKAEQQAAELLVGLAKAAVRAVADVRIAEANACYRATPAQADDFKQPNWGHVQQAFLDGAREAQANPEAGDDVFRRAADGYTKRIFAEVDPEGDKLLNGAAAVGVAPSPAPSCKQAGGCPDPHWCGRAGVCLNVPAKPGVRGTFNDQRKDQK